MQFLGEEIERMGMGCWAIGGPFYEGEQALGYGQVDDAESIATIHAALEAGLRLFDTAAVYGAGHSERLLAKALKDRPEALVISKIGLVFDEQSKQLLGSDLNTQNVLPAIENSLRRLQRDRIDLMLLHLNTASPEEATPIFEHMQQAVQSGKIRAFGWSTDFPKNIEAVVSMPGFVGVEHAMNVFHDVPAINRCIAEHDLHSLIRSPLAMGVLTGKFEQRKVEGAGDIRVGSGGRSPYFSESQVREDYAQRLAKVRELLRVGGRSLTQGALCWLLAKSDRAIPVPGARSVLQIQENAGALAFGPLPVDTMQEIESVIARDPEAEACEL